MQLYLNQSNGIDCLQNAKATKIALVLHRYIHSSMMSYKICKEERDWPLRNAGLYIIL